MFEQGVTNAAVARTLRVTQRSVDWWRRAWREGGTAVHEAHSADCNNRPRQNCLPTLARPRRQALALAPLPPH
ncbi:hypothetical protein DI270_007535 [Microbispora triticiradicis]|uniref:Uncharacterized protein n=3 Tax=Streptosporangiaceae TaxID=2004 RepID=A0A5R8YWT7_9ACTN|nr:hypothetical protein DI270_007535 [Microbispora triticiradicis]TLP57841.1 hypothetical protein FED44_19955 [Microbispora fusca]